MKKIMKPEILVPLMIVASVVALLVFGGAMPDSGGHTHGNGEVHSH